MSRARSLCSWASNSRIISSCGWNSSLLKYPTLELVLFVYNQQLFFSSSLVANFGHKYTSKGTLEFIHCTEELKPKENLNAFERPNLASLFIWSSLRALKATPRGNV